MYLSEFDITKRAATRKELKVYRYGFGFKVDLFMVDDWARTVDTLSSGNHPMDPRETVSYLNSLYKKGDIDMKALKIARDAHWATKYVKQECFALTDHEV